MSMWGKNDNAANSVNYGSTLFKKTANSANKTGLYGNTTVGAFVNKAVVSIVGVDTVEKANTSDPQSYAQHSGWNIKKTGTGSLVSITIAGGGTGYSNTDVIKVTPSSPGAVNATASLTTNATGGIISVAITNVGAGFITVNPSNVAVTNSSGGATGGSSANLVATAGGRAGRIQFETIVATGSIS